MCLVAGLLATWLLSDRRRGRVGLFLLGAVMPTFAATWQFFVGLSSPTWAARVNLQRQSQYLANLGPLLWETAWRLSVVAQYLAFFSLPLVVLGLLRPGFGPLRL